MTIRVSDPGPAVDDGLGLGLVPGRAFIDTAPLTWFELLPGDRPLVGPGDTVLPGAPLAELLHDRRVADIGAATAGESRSPGGRWSGRAGARRIGQRRGLEAGGGELLFEIGGRWRIAAGDPMVLESPAAGIVREVRPGVGISPRWPARACGACRPSVRRHAAGWRSRRPRTPTCGPPASTSGGPERS